MVKIAALRLFLFILADICSVLKTAANKASDEKNSYKVSNSQVDMWAALW
ncbi:MAG: hypothetical protein LUG99_08940 [Lachnospiraceae bacterium]|nr:hypothetical protein [Lachnospiraceae bacterium]